MKVIFLQIHAFSACSLFTSLTVSGTLRKSQEAQHLSWATRQTSLLD